MEEFPLRSAFIPLDKLLKVVGIASSGGEAHQLIASGNVKVNGAVELQKRKKLYPNDVVAFEETQILLVGKD